MNIFKISALYLRKKGSGGGEREGEREREKDGVCVCVPHALITVPTEVWSELGSSHMSDRNPLLELLHWEEAGVSSSSVPCYM